jgi:plastocyanin
MSRRPFVATTVAVAAAAAAALPALAHDRRAPGPRVTAQTAAATHVVKLGEYFLRPKQLTVRVGSRVRFVNVGKIEHTVADSTKGGTIRSRLIKPHPLAKGRSQTVTFRRAGTVYYLCTFHPDMMRGVITVRP